MILFKRLSIYSIFSLLNVLLTILAADLVIRNFGEAQFIQYSRIILYAGIVSPILTFALPSWLANNADEIAGTPSLPMLASLIVFFSLIGILFVFLIFEGEGFGFKALVISYSATTAIFSVCVSFLQFLRQLRKFLILQLAYTVFNIASIIALVGEASGSAFVRFEIVMLGHIAAIALGLKLSAWSMKVGNYETWKSAIVWGVKLSPHTALSTFLLAGDKIIIEKIFSASLFSQYMLLIALIAPFNIFVMLVNQVLKPEFYEGLKAKNFLQIKKLAYWQSSTYFAIAIMLSVFCWLMLYKLGFGNQHFKLGYTTIALVVFYNAMLAVYYPLSNIILYYENTGRLVSGTILYIAGLCMLYRYFNASVPVVKDFLIAVCILSTAYISFYISAAKRAMLRAGEI